MEITNTEFMIAEATVSEMESLAFHELNDLQLTFVGGGNAQVVVA